MGNGLFQKVGLKNRGVECGPNKKEWQLANYIMINSEKKLEWRPTVATISSNFK